MHLELSWNIAGPETGLSFNPLSVVSGYQFRWRLQIGKLLKVRFWLGILLQLCSC